MNGKQERGKEPPPPKVALHAVCGRPSEKIVLFTIAQLCDWKTGYFDRPVETLMQRTGLCRRSVQEAVTRLRAKGWLLGNDHRQHGIRVHYLALDGPEGAAPVEDEPSGPFDDWRVEEILTWAWELGLRPTGADRAVAQEWIERGFSRLLILGTLRRGVQRKRRQRDGEPIGSLRYFDSVRRDLSPEKPDDDVRSSFVNQLGHKPPLPAPPVVARRLFRQERSRRQALEAAPPRTSPQVTGEGRLAVAPPVAIGAVVAGARPEMSSLVYYFLSNPPHLSCPAKSRRSGRHAPSQSSVIACYSPDNAFSLFDKNAECGSSLSTIFGPNLMSSSSYNEAPGETPTNRRPVDTQRQESHCVTVEPQARRPVCRAGRVDEDLPASLSERILTGSRLALDSWSLSFMPFILNDITAGPKLVSWGPS